MKNGLLIVSKLRYHVQLIPDFQLTFNLQYQNRRKFFSENISNTFLSRIMQKKLILWSFHTGRPP